MTDLPEGLVTMKVDYGQPDWRENNDNLGYVEFSHDGSHLWVRIDADEREYEMDGRGAIILGEALIAMGRMLK